MRYKYLSCRAQRSVRGEDMVKEWRCSSRGGQKDKRAKEEEQEFLQSLQNILLFVVRKSSPNPTRACKTLRLVGGLIAQSVNLFHIHREPQFSIYWPGLGGTGGTRAKTGNSCCLTRKWLTAIKASASNGILYVIGHFVSHLKNEIRRPLKR